MPNPKTLSSRHIPRNNSAECVSLKPHLWAPAGAAILALAVFIAYFPSLSGGFIWDDAILLTQNSLIVAPDGLHRIWRTTEPIDFWPLTNTTFWLEWRLWGMCSAGCHATNLVLHIAASLLIWAILRKLFIPGAFLAALIFALHPVNVESVAWIAQRKNTLSMLFFLLSILWYLKADMHTAIVGMAPARSRKGPWVREKTFLSFILHPSSCHFWYWLSFAAFVSAMLSKGSAAVLPALVLGIIWWRRRLIKWDLLRTAPFFIVAAALSLVNIWFQNRDFVESIRDAGFLERIMDAGAVAWFYLYKALLPLNLIFIYPQWNIQTGNFLWWLPLLAAVVVAAVLWLYRKTWGRPFLFAWGFFCVSLLPVMGLTDVYFMKYSLVADHYQYTAVIGIIALTTAGWSTWHAKTNGPIHCAVNCLAAIVVLALASLTWRQSGLYHDAMTLYQATLERNPKCWMAYNNLGLIFEEKGDLKKALDYYNQSILFNPKNAEAYNNLGGLMLKTGQLPKAIAQYELALRYKQNFAEAHNNLGMALVNIGRLQDAIEHYEQALRLRPNYAETQNNLGQVLAQTDRPLEAIKCYEQALTLKPDFPEAQYNLGLLLLQTGRPRESIKYFEQSLKLKPDYFITHNNLGTALLRTGRLEEAIEHYEQARRINPDYIGAYVNLAPAYAQAHRLADAVACAKKGLHLAQSQGQTDTAKQFEDLLKSLGN
jgi:tetratricopeptide (TPR) repeat protein